MSDGYKKEKYSPKKPSKQQEIKHFSWDDEDEPQPDYGKPDSPATQVDRKVRREVMGAATDLSDKVYGAGGKLKKAYEEYEKRPKEIKDFPIFKKKR